MKELSSYANDAKLDELAYAMRRFIARQVAAETGLEENHAMKCIAVHPSIHIVAGKVALSLADQSEAYLSYAQHHRENGKAETDFFPVHAKTGAMPPLSPAFMPSESPPEGPIAAIASKASGLANAMFEEGKGDISKEAGRQFHGKTTPIVAQLRAGDVNTLIGAFNKICPPELKIDGTATTASQSMAR